MTAADWISDRRALIDAATEGPWEAEPLEGNIVTPAHGTIIEVLRWTDADAELIADSRASLPAALDALEAVLKLHFRREWLPGKDPVYFGQTEFPDQCDHCRRTYPCETITAITTALGSEDAS